MNLVINAILAAQMLSALVMIGLILIQHGKGADMGAAFGSGGSGSLFGASGSANFLSRATAGLAAVFFVCTLALAYFGNVRSTGSSGSVLDQPAAVVPVPTTPASQIPGTTVPAGNTVPTPTVSAPVAPPPVEVPVATPAVPADVPPVAPASEPQAAPSEK